ncbi:hypothetical protein Cus16_2906 [Curtobacterium sp. ER1/6]|nr:hypothetical protein Cus16_2906 [Curtobacterium sp. ER1/6]
MVGEALVVARGEGRVDRVDRVALPGLTEHEVEHARVQLVDGVVLVADLRGQGDVLGGEQTRELLGHLHVVRAHLLERGAQALRHDLLGEALAGELRDVLGHVAHALERGADAEGGHDDTEVAGDRGLAGEDVDRDLVEAVRRLVDLGVVGDHLLGEGDVGLAERLGRTGDRGLDEPGDLGQTLLDVLELLLEDFAHGGCASLMRTGRVSSAQVNER